MRRLHYRLDTRTDFSVPVRRHNFLLRCLPVSEGAQTLLSGSVYTDPLLPLCEERDSFGNRILSGSCWEAHPSLSYRAEGTVEIDLSRRRPEVPHPMYRHPGVMTRPDRDLTQFLAALPLAGRTAAEQAALLSQAVSDRFTYTPGVTRVSTTAAESFRLGQGVCQDYAHVLLTLCRMAGLPARYCMGLTEGEGATHAWAEVYYDGLWHGYDPTRRKRVDERYLRLAVGRDWRDCPVERGTFWGCADQTQTVFAVMNPLNH